MTLKAYYVDRISRATVKVIVLANSAREALDKAKEGDCISIDVDYEPRGYSKPRRAPMEDPQ